MIRALFSILLAAALAATAMEHKYTSIWVLFFFFTLSAGIVIGIPAMLIAKRRGWVSWWHAATAGALTATPWVLIYLFINPGHTELAGLPNSMRFLGLGVVAGVLVWVMGIYRNPAFGRLPNSLPRSLMWLIPFLGFGYIYTDALEPVQIYGCVTGYSPVERPTSWHHADVEVVSEEGMRFVGKVTVGAADPGIVGSCAYGYKIRSFTLLSTRYFFSGVTSVGCKRECNSQKGA